MLLAEMEIVGTIELRPSFIRNTGEWKPRAELEIEPNTLTRGGKNQVFVVDRRQSFTLIEQNDTRFKKKEIEEQNFRLVF